MNPFGFIFYLLAVILVVSTVMAISRRQALHAVVYLMISFIATGLIFYLLGAPFLGLLEIIIYAGAIMVFFLFVVMTIRLPPRKVGWRAGVGQWVPALVLAGICLAIAGVMVSADPASQALLPALTAKPREFGRFLFQRYWFAVEIASFLLLVGLVGALFLGRQDGEEEKIRRGEE